MKYNKLKKVRIFMKANIVGAKKDFLLKNLIQFIKENLRSAYNFWINHSQISRLGLHSLVLR